MLFDMPPQNGPVEPIVRTAEIDGIYRYTLTRAWGAGPCLVWCGLNPSTADHRIDDRTIKREMRFSFLWGYGSMVKVNIYPFRSPSTKQLNRWREGMEDNSRKINAWYANLGPIAHFLKDCPKPMAAWGNGVRPGDLRNFLDFLDDEDGPVDWHCLDTTKSGAPRHTLARGKHRIPDTQMPIPWRRP